MAINNNIWKWKIDDKQSIFFPFGGGSNAYIRILIKSNDNNRIYESYFLDTKIPILSDSKEHWKSIKLFIKWLSLGIQYKPVEFEKWAYKKLRQKYYYSKTKEWEDVLDPIIASWAHNRIHARSKDCGCVDNSRVARIDNTGQLRRYYRQKNKGCCGFSDWVERAPDGKLYRLGFNYGH